LIEPGDSAATVNNLRTSATLFRVGFVIDLVTATGFLLTAMALYVLLKHVHELVAAAMVIFVAVSTAVTYLYTLNEYTALTIATDADYTEAFGQVGSDALVMLFASMRTSGEAIDGMFFGLWLLPLGYLVFKSGFFPKVLGVLLIIGFLAGSYSSSFGFFRPTYPRPRRSWPLGRSVSRSSLCGCL
jgi:hypothetical protein